MDGVGKYWRAVPLSGVPLARKNVFSTVISKVAVLVAACGVVRDAAACSWVIWVGAVGPAWACSLVCVNGMTG